MVVEAYREVGERIGLAREALRCCGLCPRKCGVDRIAGEKGYCGLDDKLRCFREILYFGEERELVPSHQIHLSGCNLQCEFCLVGEWNEEPWAAKEVDFDYLVERIWDRWRQGAKTLNLLGGEPAVNVYGILELLGRLEPMVRVVWNSNMYYGEIVGALIRGLVDVYLADLKCGSADCAEMLLGAKDYVSAAKENILKSREEGEVIVRHVVLPGHRECCLKPILRWLATAAAGVKVSLRGNYVPPAEAAAAPKEYLREEDMQDAVDLGASLGLKLIE
jgi:putative pyruvate formate lyase activating enzyme